MEEDADEGEDLWRSSTRGLGRARGNRVLRAWSETGGTFTTCPEGLVVPSTREDIENVFWYPLTSVTRRLKGRPRGWIRTHSEPKFACRRATRMPAKGFRPQS